MAKDFLPIARMRSSGLHPIPHTRAFSNGGGWVQSTCKFNRCTMTSPKKRIIVLQTNHCNRLYVQSLLPLSLLIAIKSILWLHVNSSILQRTTLKLCNRIKLDCILIQFVFLKTSTKKKIYFSAIQNYRFQYSNVIKTNSVFNVRIATTVMQRQCVKISQFDFISQYSFSNSTTCTYIICIGKVINYHSRLILFEEVHGVLHLIYRSIEFM